MKTFKQFLKESTFKNYKYKNHLIACGDDYGVVVYDKDGITVLSKGLKDKNAAEKYIDGLKEESSSNWDKIYDSIQKISDLIDDADDMWNGDSYMSDRKQVIKDLNDVTKEIQKTLVLLKKYDSI